MTDTTDLPIRQRDLPAWLPPEPTDGPVPAHGRAAAQLSAAAAELRTRLADLDGSYADVIDDLVARAIDGQPLDDLAPVDLDADRDRLRRRIDALARAAHVATERGNRLRTTDPTWLAWQADCRRITDDWTSSVGQAEHDQRPVVAEMFAATHPRHG